MKTRTLTGVLAGFGALGVVAIFAMAFAGMAISLYGLYLAFSASVLFGILAFFIEPAPFIIGIVYLFTHVDLAQRIVEWFSKLS